jgi:uncharacterized integral membrane protein
LSKLETALVFAGIPLVVILLVFTLVYTPVTIKPVATEPRWAAWLSPSRVVLLGSVVVALLLTMPISVRRPGDHEQMSCGNALRLDLGRQEDYADEYDAWERAYRACTADRITRVAQAVGVVSVTLLIATLMTARTSRRSSSGEPTLRLMESSAGHDR